MSELWNYLDNVSWVELTLELIARTIGILAGFLLSWYLLFRRKLNEIRRFQRGESDDILFQTHSLYPIEGTDEVVLLFRNVGSRMTVNMLYDNPAARVEVQRIADDTTMADPVLMTEGTSGFDLINTAQGHIAGELATSPFERETWLFAMTCEDRKVVRKKCIRCFLIRPQDLERFLDWNWCLHNVRVERPWHSFRIAALHRIALQWKREQENEQKTETAGSDVKLIEPEKMTQFRHARIRATSIGVYPNEKPVEQHAPVEWDKFLTQLYKIGLPKGEES